MKKKRSGNGSLLFDYIERGVKEIVVRVDSADSFASSMWKLFATSSASS